MLCRTEKNVLSDNFSLVNVYQALYFFLSFLNPAVPNSPKAKRVNVAGSGTTAADPGTTDAEPDAKFTSKVKPVGGVIAKAVRLKVMSCVVPAGIPEKKVKVPKSPVKESPGLPIGLSTCGVKKLSPLVKGDNAKVPLAGPPNTAEAEISETEKADVFSVVNSNSIGRAGSVTVKLFNVSEKLMSDVLQARVNGVTSDST